MKKLSLLPLLIFAVVNSSARDHSLENQVWVAKLTAQRQCLEGSDQEAMRLGEAINELEQGTDFMVQTAGLARLNDRMFCSACGCPSGIFYVAKIEIHPSSSNKLPSNWEVIRPESVQELSSSEKPLEFQILPVDPTH